jgi:hypothetical protein
MVPAESGGRAWRGLGATAPAALGDAWRQVHWAAQAPAALAEALIPKREDDSHVNLGWHEAAAALLTHPAGRLRAGVRPADLALLVLDGDRVAEEWPLAGHSLEEAFGWIRGAAARVAGSEPPALARRDWDMPEHPVAGGGRLSGEPAAAFEEVARWYANADLVLGGLAAANRGASEVRCWPHHFDIATLVTLDADRSAEEARSIGIGLAPADGSIPEPYLYVNPWPAPEAEGELPTLEAGGEWYREDFFGALLRASRLVEGGVPGQRERLERFLRSAVAAGRRLVEEEG